ncbi:prepilin peptidase [Gynuella sp.]|uniref:prepilin peptidase n=1 Tax=Gynuella sp. TaxID=2969146 RepID=UPI003D108E77
MLDLLQTSTVALTTIVFIFGLLIGSFLNVVIFRLPVMMKNSWTIEASEFLELKTPKLDKINLIKPDSTCPKCGHKIRAWENIPVISYLFLKGKCASCKTGISPRYPIIELVTAAFSGLIAWQFGWSMETTYLLVFVWTLISLTMIDFDTQLLPDSLVLPLLWLGLIANLNSTFTSLNEAVIGAVAGYLSLWLVYWLFKLTTGKEGMGYGDFKLFAAFGAWFGWQSLPLIILLSAAVGSVIGIGLILVKGRDKNIPIPFGPYLCGAALVYIFWGQYITQWYLGTLQV